MTEGGHTTYSDGRGHITYSGGGGKLHIVTGGGGTLPIVILPPACMMVAIKT